MVWNTCAIPCNSPVSHCKIPPQKKTYMSIVQRYSVALQCQKAKIQPSVWYQSTFCSGSQGSEMRHLDPELIRRNDPVRSFTSYIMQIPMPVHEVVFSLQWQQVKSEKLSPNWSFHLNLQEGRRRHCHLRNSTSVLNCTVGRQMLK